ncbi:MAG: hypothetical protein OEW09_03780 [Anaerolineae bacterium]|nr:hypothetical protein [Anaerolineae bacterium]
MKAIKVVPLLAVLSVVLVLAIPVHAGKGVHVPNGAVKQEFRNSGSYIQYTIEGSGGKVILNQPSGAVAVTLTGIVNGLAPNTDYYAYLWAGEAGYCPYWCGTAYPLNAHYFPPSTAGIPSWWDGSKWYGTWFRFAQFTTDASGAASFHLNMFSEEIDAGDYKLSVFVDSVSSGTAAWTYLIAEPIPVTVE